MSTIGAQIDGLKTLARILNSQNLLRSRAVGRQSEAEHLIEMLKDAAGSMERARDDGAFE